MISSLIGSVIMSAVTVAMLLAIDITDKALNKVGKYPLTTQERQILIDAGFNLKDIELIKLQNILKTKEKIKDLFHFPMRINFKGKNIPGVAIQHHLAHAASTFYNCKSNESIILTHDGCIPPGPRCGMIFYGEKLQKKVIKMIPK